MNNITLSIITIVKNGLPFISECIESVISCKNEDIEYIIIDGKSNDGTLELVKKYAKRDNRISFISENDNGIADAMNKGVNLAKGEYISHIHSDDYYVKGAIEEVLCILKKEKPLWLTGSAFFINTNGERMYSTSKKRNYDYNTQLNQNIITHPSTFIKKEIFLEVGGFNKNYKYAMDYDLFLKIGKYSIPFVFEKEIAAFRFHKGSLSSSNLTSAIKEELFIALVHGSNQKALWKMNRHIKSLIRIIIVRLRLNNFKKKIKRKFEI